MIISFAGVMAMRLRILGMLTVTTVMGSFTPNAWPAFGPGEASGRANLASSEASRGDGHSEFKVLIWFRRADPLATFNYQVYDLRKGEFTSAVVAWIKDIDAKYPAYTAYTREVDLSIEKGKTEALKVGSVVKRELTVAAALSGVILGSPISGHNRPFETLRGTNSSAGQRTQPSRFSNDRSFLQTAPATFPVPLPYPRPHP
jgi:hypothetical protein